MLAAQVASNSGTYARARAGAPSMARQNTFHGMRMVTRQRSAERRSGNKKRRSSATQRLFASSGVQPRTPTAAHLLAKRMRQPGSLSFRERMFLVVEEPTSSLFARLFAMTVRLVVLVSTVSAILASCRDPALAGGMLTRWGAAPYDRIRFGAGCFFSFEAVVRVLFHIPLRHMLVDPFIWLDVLTPMPFLIQLLLPSLSLPIMEAWSSIRLLKLCRYYEGASLLGKAVRRSIKQLVVPLFFLITMVIVCGSVLYNIEHDPIVDACAAHWRAVGVPDAFLYGHPAGVVWGCDTCGGDGGAPAEGTLSAHRCTTCAGHPANHPECLGVPFVQPYQTIPHAMWFLVVTVTTVGYGDVV